MAMNMDAALRISAKVDGANNITSLNRSLQTVALPQVNAIPQQGHSVAPAVPTAAAAASGR